MKWKYRKVVSLLLCGAIMFSHFCMLNTAADELPVYEPSISLNPEEKISDEVYAAIEDGNDMITVAIWRRSYSQTYIEKLIQQRIGFNVASIDETYEPPSQELINALNKASENIVENSDATDIDSLVIDKKRTDEYSKMLVDSYMDLTATARENENAKTTKYKTARRQIVKELYEESSKELIEEAVIPNESVLFTSSCTPLLICALSPEEIIELSNNENVENIYLYEDCNDTEESQEEPIRNGNLPSVIPLAKKSMGINKLTSTISSLKGDGVKVGLYEFRNIDFNDTNNISENGLDINRVHNVGTISVDGNHANVVAAAIVGTYGIAPHSDVYVASAFVDQSNNDFSYNHDNIIPDHLHNLEVLIGTNCDVDIINASWGYKRYLVQKPYTYLERYFDSFISNNRVLVVFASGNESYNDIWNPALSYNSITVASFIPAESQTNEIMESCCYTRYNDNGCFKPDVAVATSFSGTSCAAPVLTGMIALLYQYKPSLKVQPHVTKAIVMASCHRKIGKTYVDYSSNNSQTTLTLNETMNQGLTDRQGAGVPDAYKMICIAAQHSYGAGIYKSSYSGYQYTHFTQPLYGSNNMNVSFACLLNNIDPDNYASTVTDLDIRLQNGAFSDKTSTKTKSSTEMIYTTIGASYPDYTLGIKKFSGISLNYEYAYAWSTDNASYAANLIEDEGLYYLRNANSDNYLAKSNNSMYVVQKSYSTSPNQWVFNYSQNNNKYRISTAENSDGGLTNNNLSAYLSTTTVFPNISIDTLQDGSIVIKKNISNIVFALTSQGSSSVVWDQYDPNNIPESQKWFTESICYKRGDVNTDGSISSTDANQVLSIAAVIGAGGAISYSNKVMFLGDYNRDGDVNASDAALILNNPT